MNSSDAISLYAYPRASSRSTSRSRGVSRSSSGSLIGAEPGRSAKASSTNPASRGENTASPSATRTMARTSSFDEIVFVT